VVLCCLVGGQSSSYMGDSVQLTIGLRGTFFLCSGCSGYRYINPDDGNIGGP
jgi:hypothetical protein